MLLLLTFSLPLSLPLFRQLHVHYFEDGNLQLQSAKTVAPTDLSGASEKDLTDQIVQFIKVCDASAALLARLMASFVFLCEADPRSLSTGRARGPVCQHEQ